MQILKPYRVELAETLQQHWYAVYEPRANGFEKFLGYFPSATTILNAYPQSEHLTKWIAEQGWNESQKIKSDAGIRGTNVHKAIERLLANEELDRSSYSLDEWWRLSTFVAWHAEYKPEVIATEIAVFSKKYKYAGRVDFIAKVGGEINVLDFKTSSSIHNNFPLQFAAYAQAIEEMTDLKIANTGAIQLGAKNKKGFRYVLYPDWKDHVKVFQNVRGVWDYDSGREKEPPVLNLPQTLKL